VQSNSPCRLGGARPFMVQLSTVAAAFVIMFLVPWQPACASNRRPALVTALVWCLATAVGGVALHRSIRWLNSVERGLRGRGEAVLGRIGIVIVGVASFALLLVAIVMTLYDLVAGMVCF